MFEARSNIGNVTFSKRQFENSQNLTPTSLKLKFLKWQLLNIVSSKDE